MHPGRVVVEHVIFRVIGITAHAFGITVYGRHGTAATSRKSNLGNFQRGAAGVVNMHVNVGSLAVVPARKDRSKRNQAIRIGYLPAP